MRVTLLFHLGDSAEEAGHLKTAKRFFERGAVLGNALCCQRLGLMYDKGAGCRANKKLAIYWYKLAWRSRDCSAANNIAIIYREFGQHRPAFAWFERAARAGDGDALVDIAKCYLAEAGVSKDRAEAIRHLRAAAALRPFEHITQAGWEDARLMLRE